MIFTTKIEQTWCC